MNNSVDISYIPTEQITTACRIAYSMSLGWMNCDSTNVSDADWENINSLIPIIESLSIHPLHLEAYRLQDVNDVLRGCKQRDESMASGIPSYILSQLVHFSSDKDIYVWFFNMAIEMEYSSFGLDFKPPSSHTTAEHQEFIESLFAAAIPIGEAVAIYVEMSSCEIYQQFNSTPRDRTERIKKQFLHFPKGSNIFQIANWFNRYDFFVSNVTERLYPAE